MTTASIYKQVRLGDVCDTTSGGTPSRSVPSYFGGGIPWVKSGDLTDGDVWDVDETISREGLEGSSAKLLPKGTLLLAMYGATVGKLGILQMYAATNQAICGIRTPESLEPKFLFYQLLARRPALVRMSVGGAQPNISQRLIRDLMISLPPLSEQRRIVDLLSRAENIVRMRREAEQKAKEIIPALFLDMFGDPVTNPKGWAVRTISDVVVAVEYGTSTKAGEGTVGVPMIRMGNVDVQGRLKLHDLKYVELEEVDRRKYRLQPGDILFNRTNSKELVGKTGIWRSDRDAVAASYFIRVRVNETVLAPDYLWAFMNTPHMKKTLFGMARGAIGQSNINSQELRSIPLAVPSLALQRTFSARVCECLELEQYQEVAIGGSESVFQSLLAGVFSERQVT